MSSPWTTVFLPVDGSDSHDAMSGMRDPAADGAVVVEVPEQGLGHVVAGLGHELDGGELHRLVVVDPPGQRVADRHLDGDGDRGDGERDDEPEPVVAVPAAPQHAHRVHRRDEEAADDVGGHDHVGRHQRHGVVEDHAHRVDRRRSRRPS